jgi:perosamine synthetase
MKTASTPPTGASGTAGEPEFIAPARPVIGEEEIEAAVRVLRSGHVVQGPEVAGFEEEFSAFVGGRHCVAVNSGTSALLLALTALRIGPGDEVIVPSFTFAATANAVRLAGAVPVFADIDPDTFCLDPDAVLAAIGPRTAALMPVHLYGHPAAMGPLGALAAQRGLAVVEDAAQAHAASYQGAPVGTFGDAACFSFYPTKNVHSLEGGMVATADPALARRLRLLRNQGMDKQYENEIVGYNMRLTDVAAAVGRVQLRSLEAWTEQRRANAQKLDAGLGGGMVTVPAAAPGVRHVYHQYTVRVSGGHRDALRAHLAARRIGSGVYYPVPVHRLAAFDLDLDLEHTRRAAHEVLSLPVHPRLSDADLDRIVEAVHGYDFGGSP